MSLGVLNNLSAMYAEHNLNNTQASLSKTLQQLSSGSKINSGADDAAGLSLVNGLMANSTALTQSQTNATEGVGLLQVADGALSQVTSLLNRAVTLATESANGTLNAAQDTAANNEYQSILSEISNIGSTTTYNNQQVFNTTTNIFTGDSSSSGASINSLNIRSLSASNVGDSNGTMAYSTSASNNNIFLDLTKGEAAGAVTDKDIASVNDYLTGSAGGSNSITVTTLSATGTNVTNTISVGGSSGYANTAQGMISAINNSGYGISASFTTDKVAGSGNSGDTGIMITGSVGSGIAPSTASDSGSITGFASSSNGADIMSGSLTFQVGNNQAVTVTATQVATALGRNAGAVTANDFVTYLNTNSQLGVSATFDNTNNKLTLESASSANVHQALTVSSNLVDNTASVTGSGLSYSATSGYLVGVSETGILDAGVGASLFTTGGANGGKTAGTMFTISGGQGSNGTMNLSGKLTIKDANTTAQATLTLTLGTAGTTDTLANLTSYINSGAFGGGSATSGLTAAYNASTGTMTVTQAAGGNGNTAITYASAPGANTAQALASGSTTTGGTATISYTDKAGVALSGSDLSNQADAQKAMTLLNAAITAVSAQDGYIGAQINTLNAVSSVLSTQQQNVVSAQNAVQATDYAQAASNMSKYQILSQTGISALAQANSMSQLVTKLLQ